MKTGASGRRRGSATRSSLRGSVPCDGQHQKPPAVRRRRRRNSGPRSSAPGDLHIGGRTSAEPVRNPPVQVAGRRPAGRRAAGDAQVERLGVGRPGELVIRPGRSARPTSPMATSRLADHRLPVHARTGRRRTGPRPVTARRSRPRLQSGRAVEQDPLAVGSSAGSGLPADRQPVPRCRGGNTPTGASARPGGHGTARGCHLPVAAIRGCSAAQAWVSRVLLSHRYGSGTHRRAARPRRHPPGGWASRVPSGSTSGAGLGGGPRRPAGPRRPPSTTTLIHPRRVPPDRVPVDVVAGSCCRIERFASRRGTGTRDRRRTDRTAPPRRTTSSTARSTS